jgi:hypothetical protein
LKPFSEVRKGEPLPRHSAAIVASNLLAPAGVLLLGWNAAEAIFLIWLDTLLVSLQLGALALAAATRTFAPPAGMHKGGWWIGVGMGMLFIAPVFFAPPFVVGIELHETLKPQFPQGPLAAAFADRMIYLWIAVEVLVRGFQVLARASDILHNTAAIESFTARALDQLFGLMFRAVILINLAWLSSWFGRPGLLLFLFASSAFLVYTELHENWVRQLYGRLLRWEEELRARAKDRSNP